MAAMKKKENDSSNSSSNDNKGTTRESGSRSRGSASTMPRSPLSTRLAFRLLATAVSLSVLPAAA